MTFQVVLLVIAFPRSAQTSLSSITNSLGGDRPVFNDFFVALLWQSVLLTPARISIDGVRRRFKDFEGVPGYCDRVFEYLRELSLIAFRDMLRVVAEEVEQVCRNWQYALCCANNVYSSIIR